MITKKRRKNLALVFFLIVIIGVLIYKNNINEKEKILISNDLQSNLVTSQNVNENYSQNNEKTNTNIETKENIIKYFKGYPVIAKLEIPKINLETYVISEYSKEALGVSVTKFYGGNPNEVGNFCIAGHNYITKNMFHDIKKLSNKDEIILTDLEGNSIEYEVYLIETVEPTETKCLSQKTNGRVELTLITCTTDSSKRIIVKAVEMKRD